MARSNPVTLSGNLDSPSTSIPPTPKPSRPPTPGRKPPSSSRTAPIKSSRPPTPSASTSTIAVTMPVSTQATASTLDGPGGPATVTTTNTDTTSSTRKRKASDKSASSSATASISGDHDEHERKARKKAKKEKKREERKNQEMDRLRGDVVELLPGPSNSGSRERKRERKRKRKSKDGATPVIRVDVDGEAEEGEVVEIDKNDQEVNNVTSFTANLRKGKEKERPKKTEEAQLGDDFIPFTLEDEDEQEDEGDRPPPKLEDRDRRYNQNLLGVGDPKRYSDRERDKDSRGKGKEREWDAGKDAYWDRERDRDRDRDRDRKARFDPNDGYVSKKERMDAASRKAPWTRDVDWEGCTNVAQLLHREVDAFVKYISPTPEEDEIRSLVVLQIQRCISAKFPDAKVKSFGSYETKLYLPLGDIDLVIISKSMAYSDRVTALRAVSNTLRTGGITDRVSVIAKAKVPIVKFITTHGKFAVDISINMNNGIEAISIVNNFLSTPSLSALRSLVMITKAFLSQRSMNEVFTGGLGSYAIICLCVSFLQHHPKIRRGEIDPQKNLGVLCMEFFELYGRYFNYEEVGISVRDGGTYFSKSERGWKEWGNKAGLLSIEDPADPSNDISKGSFNIGRVRQTFAGAHSIMTAAAHQHATVLSARRSGRAINLRGGYSDSGEMSILSSVLGVTQETINRRRLVQELYDKRTLHRLLTVQPRATTTMPYDPDSLNVAPPPGPSEVEDETITPQKRKRGSTPEVTGSNKRKQYERVPALEEGEADEDEDEKDAKEEEEEEEESRYGIPPKKRRRRTFGEGVHDMFTSDDEDDGTDSSGSESESDGVLSPHQPESDSDEDSLAEEERQYEMRSRGGGLSRSDSSAKRAYWASKGMPMGDDSP